MPRSEVQEGESLPLPTKNDIKHEILLPLILSTNILLRYLVSCFPYSGYGKPPLYGDYEAQRHWMEITVNLPVNEWYENTTRNDLQYWGLDYPPLTAYFSYIWGKIGEKLVPEAIALFSSRGIETPSTKIFMRSTVLISDVLFYFVPVYLFVRAFHKKGTQHTALFAILLQPALIIIDHGHFQYNCVSLGLTVLAIVCIFNSQEWLGSILYTLSINYKIISLYHAPAFFTYLLARNLRKNDRHGSIMRVAGLGIVVISTFAAVWLPFIFGGKDTVLQVVHRLFPLARGLYEDKVANFWCAISPVFKLKQVFDISQLGLISIFTTLIFLLPSNVNLFLHPTKERFLFTLLNTSMSFFMFSFQVHEKSILFPLLPATLLLPNTPLVSSWFITVALFSMYPLLYKDGLVIPYLVFLVGLQIIVWRLSLNAPSHLKISALASMTGIVLLHVLEITVSPPPSLPDLFVLLFMVYSFCNFLLFFVYFHWAQFRMLSPSESQLERKKMT